jgi:hypothetical protein
MIHFLLSRRDYRMGPYLCLILCLTEIRIWKRSALVLLLEAAAHIVCDCEAIAYLRFRHLGQFFVEPSDYYDAP